MNGDSPVLVCPSCGDEYVAGSTYCSDCRVALVPRGRADQGAAPSRGEGVPEGYVEVGSFTRLAAVMVMRRLEDAGLPVAVLWSDPRHDGLATLAVPAGQEEFADALLREFPVEDELPPGSTEDYLNRIETRLTEIALLLDELRARPEPGEGDW